MQTTRLLLPAIIASLFMSGCQTPAPVVIREPAAPAAQTGRDADLARIIALKDQGVITEAQAVEIISAMVSGKTVPAISTQPKVTPPSAPAAPAAPAPAPAAPVVATPAPAPAAPAQVSSPAIALDNRYQPAKVLEGRLRSIGSDTMDLLVANWERIFTQYHPGLRVLHEGRGSSTATPALIEGQCDIGPMSRAMLDAEVTRFRERFGYAPTQIRAAIDALGVYVHPENPLAKQGLTLEQLDAIFSSTRKRGGAEQIVTWGQLGLGGQWASAPIRVYGRNRASGTYGYFRDTALAKGEFGQWVAEQPSSQAVVAKVESDRFGIGFSGVGYKTDGVAMLPLAKTTGAAFVAAAEETALDGSYPLARALYLAINRDPAAPISDLHREFLTFVLGPIGQEVVKQEGYYPLPDKIVAEELAKLK